MTYKDAITSGLLESIPLMPNALLEAVESAARKELKRRRGRGRSLLGEIQAGNADAVFAALRPQGL